MHPCCRGGVSFMVGLVVQERRRRHGRAAASAYRAARISISKSDIPVLHQRLCAFGAKE